ncbi:uncharacterized protein LOC106051918 [Biomphalaria glabrata]|uniref:Uncharacterized protein LOC106051918 n=1 Tax=Biomphalaria glabrata TaxID=6526 RepID=A0A9W3BL94_BIOGL|nr:uncharacterized protein LOC106051918 [Biomphalaria glabrata]
MTLVARSSRLLIDNLKRHLSSVCHIHHRTSHKFPYVAKFLSYSPAISQQNLVFKYFTASVFLSLRKLSTTRSIAIFWKDKISVQDTNKMNNSHTSHDGKSLVNRYIFVQTLDQFYEDVPDGIILDTAYADSRPGEAYDKYVPVVLGLHDTPGTHHDLLPILGTFAKLGCRTIAPTFPGHGETQSLMRGLDNVFCHSTIERALFVHNFLNELDIRRVDMVVAIGAACYPALRLCAGGDLTNFYRSMALISPWPLTRKRYEANIELARRIQYLWDNPLLRPPVRLLLPSYKDGKSQTIREKVTSAYLLNNLNLPEAAGFALAAGILNVPRFVMFGECDHEVEKNLYYDFVDKMEIPKANISTYKGKLDFPKLPGAMAFPEDNYDIHMEHPGVISISLLSLLKLFYPNIQL